MRDTRLSAFARIVLIALMVFVTGCEYVQGKFFKMLLEPSAPDAPTGVVAYRDILPD